MVQGFGRRSGRVDGELYLDRLHPHVVFGSDVEFNGRIASVQGRQRTEVRGRIEKLIPVLNEWPESSNPARNNLVKAVVIPPLSSRQGVTITEAWILDVRGERQLAGKVLIFYAPLLGHPDGQLCIDDAVRVTDLLAVVADALAYGVPGAVGHHERRSHVMV